MKELKSEMINGRKRLFVPKNYKDFKYLELLIESSVTISLARIFFWGKNEENKSDFFYGLYKEGFLDRSGLLGMHYSFIDYKNLYDGIVLYDKKLNSDDSLQETL